MHDLPACSMPNEALIQQCVCMTCTKHADSTGVSFAHLTRTDAPLRQTDAPLRRTDAPSYLHGYHASMPTIHIYATHAFVTEWVL